MGAGGVGKEEPSMREEWMEKINDIRMPRATMNKLVMNYLVTEGFKDAAEKFQEEAGVSAGQDLSMLDNRISIRDNIQAGNIEEAISLDNQWHLQLQHLIELIRKQKVEEALQYAAEHLAERGEE